MNIRVIHINETDSTSLWLRRQTEDQSSCEDPQDTGAIPPLCVWADYQTAGRGQGTNHWEGERGKNLLFSLLFRPDKIAANQQFRISMAISLAICEALGQHVGDLCIKWPNDIYWRDGKIGGILIENTLTGRYIKDCIIGVGLNINQRVFRSDAPNPVSLWQICEQETDREPLLHDILRAFDRLLGQNVRGRYLSSLYRRKGFHPYVDGDGPFMAELMGVEDDGHLLLRDDNGKDRRYAFKEVQFII